MKRDDTFVWPYTKAEATEIAKGYAKSSAGGMGYVYFKEGHPSYVPTSDAKEYNSIYGENALIVMVNENGTVYPINTEPPAALAKFKRFYPAVDYGELPTKKYTYVLINAHHNTYVNRRRIPEILFKTVDAADDQEAYNLAREYTEDNHLIWHHICFVFSGPPERRASWLYVVDAPDEGFLS